MLPENQPNRQPGLFGLKYSNRDFTQKTTWGKNCFNSSFPASLCSYIYSRNLDNVYLKLDSDLKVIHSTINTIELYGINPKSNNLFYAFETQFTPYQQYLIGTLPGVDLVTQARDLGVCLQAIEIKLYDFTINNSFNHKKIIDNLSYNTKNDKAFAVSGRVTHIYIKSEILKQPRIKKSEIKEIIIGGGQNLLSPERRFDAIVYNSPDLFD